MWHCGVDEAYTRLSGLDYSGTCSRRVHCLHEGWQHGFSQITLGFLVISCDCSQQQHTPCPEKNGTNNILGITLTKFNKFSKFLAQFMLTCQLTKKITKSTITNCTTLRNNDISLTSSKCQQDSALAHQARATMEFLERETPQFISLLLWPPNSPDLNPVDYSVWSFLQEVYKTCITDLDDLKHRIRTEWAKLDYAVVAAAVRQWHRRLSTCVKVGGGHFEHCF